jgi:hypothetical protein
MSTGSAKHVEHVRASRGRARGGDRAGSDPPYPVLIRLPLVPLSTAPKRPAAMPDELPEILPLHRHELPAETDPVATSEPTPGPAAAAPSEAPARPLPSATGAATGLRAWSRFQGVRVLGQVFVGLLMLGLCIAAYLMMVGGTDPTSTPSSAGVSAPDELPAINVELPTGAPQLASEQASSPSGSKPVAPAKATSATGPAAREPADAKTGTASAATESTAETPESSAPSLEQGSAAAATPNSAGNYNRDFGLSSGNARAAALTASGGAMPGGTEPQSPMVEPPETATLLGPANTGVETAVSYPVTDPGRFQYPAEYHELLRSRSITRPGTDNGPEPTGRNPNAWQPNTARLQPSMDPPPIR